VNPLVEESRIKYAFKALNGKGIPTFEAEELIRKVVEEYKRPCVSWSGGKCSTVVLHMALKIKPDILVIFNDTGVEFPETYAYVNKMAKEWNLNLLRT